MMKSGSKTESETKQTSDLPIDEEYKEQPEEMKV